MILRRNFHISLISSLLRIDLLGLQQQPVIQLYTVITHYPHPLLLYVKKLPVPFKPSLIQLLKKIKFQHPNYRILPIVVIM